jgi:sporulation protein YlmC with PRC-barrel domain
MTAVGTEVDLGLRLLDDQLFDAKEHRCGRVDDVQLKGSPGAKTEVAALLIGAGAWGERLRRPFSSLVEGLGPDYMHVVSWGQVAAIGTAVSLAHTADELGLEGNDGRNVQWVGSPPRGTIRLSALLGATLATASGHKLGRIWDVRAERQTKVPDERINEAWRVTGLITGRMGWEERIGLSPEGDPTEGKTFIPWQSVHEIGDGVVTITTPAAS